MPVWHEAMNDLLALEREDGLSVDQRIQLVQAKALLSVAQELSLMHHGGVNLEYGDEA